MNIVALILMIVGALNWLLVGIFNFNLVTWIFGTSFMTTVLYILVGLGGIWGIVMLFQRNVRKTELMHDET
jgi:uncharacterized membrane protein YuzA (DUF378 family)